MTITNDDLNAFHDFAVARIASTGAESLQELVEVWEREHPPAKLHAQNVAAVRAAIRDMNEGDTGRPASQVLNEIRAELAGRRAR